VHSLRHNIGFRIVDRSGTAPAHPTEFEPVTSAFGAQRNTISPVEACRRIGYERASSGAPGVVRGQEKSASCLAAAEIEILLDRGAKSARRPMPPFGPARAQIDFRMARPISLMIEGWMPSVGSSSTSSFGRITSARPMASCCCWPPERSPPRRPSICLQHRKQLETCRRERCGRRASAAHSRSSRFSFHREQRKDLPALRHECDARPRAVIAALRSIVLPLEGNEPLVIACGRRSRISWSCRRRCGRARR
jgi:hypothetical protein